MDADKELPQRIGPYRILERIGSGGMGEVFLAHHEQLQRRVAIKRIRQDTELHPEHRERFRREARLAARLCHPAIVQVHDLLTEGETDHLILEYVEGTTLRKLARKGPLPAAQVLDLARQIAQGLQEAHRQEIVHRDLKTENILVTPSGQAKITDFGIAKRLVGEGPDVEETLTRADTILGTYRAMSPEQARGRPLDHRTDLFSFGVLLYELLTGRSPFEADNGLATLDRIVHHRQTPVRELSPEIPEPLSRLVDRLLEKDPGLRPRSAGEVWKDLEEMSEGTRGNELPTVSATEVLVPKARDAAPATSGSESVASSFRSRWVLAAVLLTTMMIGASAYLATHSPAEPVYIGVLRPEIGHGAGTARAELLATGLRVFLLQGLIDLQEVSPLSFEELDEATGSPEVIARTVSADELIGSRLDCQGEICRLALTRLGAEGRALWADSFEVPADDVSLLSRVVLQHLRDAYPKFQPRAGRLEVKSGRDELEKLLQLRMRMDSDPGTSFGEILTELEAFRRQNPGNLDTLLLEARASRRRFARSRDAVDLERADRLIRQAQKLAPSDPEPLLLQVDIALARQDLLTAEKTLKSLEEILPGDARVLERRAQALVAQGRSDAGLALLGKAARMTPSARRLSYLAQLEVQHGRFEQARGHLELLLQRSPGNPKGLSSLATLELLHGNLRRAVSLYEELDRISPGMVQLSNLGVAYLLLRDYARAEKIFQRGMDLEPGNALTLLNLADAHLLQDKKVTGRALYLRVIELADADLAAGSAALLTVKAQALAHLGRGPEAVAAVQEALRLAPAQGPVAYEASLVYALLQEETSALVNAQRALKLGVAPRLFDLPWFDSLKRRPELQKELRADQ